MFFTVVLFKSMTEYVYIVCTWFALPRMWSALLNNCFYCDIYNILYNTIGRSIVIVFEPR